MTTAWFHCFAGTAGDMTLGALIDAGADPAAVADLVARLDIDGYALTFEPVLRCGVAATHAVVVVDHDTITTTTTITPTTTTTITPTTTVIGPTE